MVIFYSLVSNFKFELPVFGCWENGSISGIMEFRHVDSCKSQKEKGKLKQFLLIDVLLHLDYYFTNALCIILKYCHIYSSFSYNYINVNFLDLCKPIFELQCKNQESKLRMQKHYWVLQAHWCHLLNHSQTRALLLQTLFLVCSHSLGNPIEHWMKKICLV